MTNLLLILIAVLLAVRIVLQVRQGKRAFEKMYCAPSEWIDKSNSVYRMLGESEEDYQERLKRIKED